MKPHVTIEYCTAWNYEPRAASLATSIRKQANVDSIELMPSRGGAFEVHLNRELLHSKLQTGEWPDFDQLAQQIKSKIF